MYITECIRLFSKLRKLVNWQLADHIRRINCDHQGPRTEFNGDFEKSFISV